MSENMISGFVSIKKNKLVADGKLLFELAGANPKDFFAAAYTALNIDYPKFFKMDNLCKTGFLAAEILLRDKGLKAKYAPEETGVFFYNSNSSLDSDLLYQHSTETIPSPALFVYTLPNIVIGELCIRHGIKGESACFIFDIFESVFQASYLNGLLDQGKIKAGISGWADFYDNKFEALFYLVEKGEPGIGLVHNSQNIDKIYSNPWKS